MKTLLRAVVLILANMYITHGRAEEPAEFSKPSQEAITKFFADSKNALLVTGRIVDCCGRGDAVLTELQYKDAVKKVSYMKIVDTMLSSHGRVGQIIIVPDDTRTRHIQNPFERIVVFIYNDGNGVYCSTYSSGG